MTMKRVVKAPGHRVLVRLKSVQKKTESGIILMEDSVAREQESVIEAHVMDIGPDAFKDHGSGKPWCKAGDCVQISKYAGAVLRDIDEEGNIYRIVNDIDIHAVFPEERVEL